MLKASYLIALMLLLPGWGQADGTTPTPARFETLAGAPIAISSPSVATIVAFWRADCAPCLLELHEARAYASAARPGRFLFVGLQDASDLRIAATKMGTPPELLARAPGSPARILAEYGGSPPRLPLAVAFYPGGAVCTRHSGLLGTDRVSAWLRLCGVKHADR